MVYSIPANIPIHNRDISGTNRNAYTFALLTAGFITSNGYRKNVIWAIRGIKVCSGSKSAPSAVVVSAQVRNRKVAAKNAETQLSTAWI